MGLIDFVKDAGEKLLGTVKGSDALDTTGIEKSIAGLGLQVENLKVTAAGDTATVSGRVQEQEVREKTVLVVGNTQGVAQVEDQIEVAEPKPESKYHQVVSGDTLSKIAKSYYGDASAYPAIFEANRPMLKDPDKIYPGQVLRIPPRD